MAAGGPAGNTRPTVSGIGIARPAASTTAPARAGSVATKLAQPASSVRRVIIMAPGCWRTCIWEKVTA
jgi:hypothetical protein